MLLMTLGVRAGFSLQSFCPKKEGKKDFHFNPWRKTQHCQKTLHKTPIETYNPAVSYQLSAVSYQLSANSSQLTTQNSQPSTHNPQLKTHNPQPKTHQTTQKIPLTK